MRSFPEYKVSGHSHPTAVRPTGPTYSSRWYLCPLHLPVCSSWYKDSILQSSPPYVKAQTLSWFGHINRMPETSIVKKIYKWKPFTRRPVGRPKSRWAYDVRNDLKKMKLRNWAGQVQDRLKWKDIVEKAKTLPEL